jgi:hypothetical protein
MERSCENCRNSCKVGHKMSYCIINERKCWEPDYPTLERENAELKQALERACKSVALNRVHECPIERDCWIKHDCLCGDEVCIKRLMNYFEEGLE